MNQKEANAYGFTFGSANAQKVLKRIREHVVWGDVALEDYRQFDEALCLLDPIGRKYEAEWLRRCEANRARRAAREARAA